MLRPAAPDDRPTLVALALAEDAAWSDAPEASPDEAGELIDHHGAGVVFEVDGRIAGWTAVDEGGSAIVLIDPRDDPGPALRALSGWLGERGRLEIEAYAADARRIAWLEGNGYAYRRSVFDLGRDVDPPLAAAAWPDGVAVDRHEPGADDGAVHELVYVDAAWSEVPGHTERSLDGWRATVSPDHHGWVARRDGRPVGWVVGRVFEDGRGFIQQIAVARAARRAGLGRALLLHALADLRARGATAFGLGVQGDNAQAIGLYREVGFEVLREWRVYASARSE